MSMPSSVVRTPTFSPSRAPSAISAACNSAFVGMQPRCRQVPPTLSRSTMTTDIPSSAARNAQAYPPLPPPRMTMSASCRSATVRSPRVARHRAALGALLLFHRSLGGYTRATLQPFDEGSDRDTGAAFGRVVVDLALVVRRAGHVEVRPRDAVGDELLEEQARHEHPAVLVAGVLQIGGVGLERLLQLLRQWHRPRLLAGPVGGGKDLVAERLVVRHHAVDLRA